LKSAENEVYSPVVEAGPIRTLTCEDARIGPGREFLLASAATPVGGLVEPDIDETGVAASCRRVLRSPSYVLEELALGTGRTIRRP
jgi:hypothetical protein